MEKRFSLLLGLILIVSLTQYSNLFEKGISQDEFEAWKGRFGKQFSHLEEVYRRNIFNNNLKIIREHNENPERTYDLGINQFTVYTQELNKVLNTVSKKLTEEQQFDPKVGAVDWTTSGAIGPVKDQGDCGSCWAFATTGAIQGLKKIKDKQVVSLSQQQLMDCSVSYGNFGCQGGLMSQALRYVRDHGITLQKTYPYTAVQGPCKKNDGEFKISGWVDPTGCTLLSTALHIAPVAVAVDASRWSLYSSGVFNNCVSNPSLNHGVLLVGEAPQYWKIKNSWSQTWGQQGYIRIARGNTCGVCSLPSYPIK